MYKVVRNFKNKEGFHHVGQEYTGSQVAELLKEKFIEAVFSGVTDFIKETKEHLFPKKEVKVEAKAEQKVDKKSKKKVE